MDIHAEERRSTEGACDRLATKADVGDARTEVANVRTEIAKSEARTAQRILESEARNRRWFIAIAGLMVAAVTLLDRLFG